MRYFPVIAAISSALLISSPIAQAETRYHDAHVHGQGTLNIAVEKQTLYMEMDIPAHDILGYESIKTDTQRAELKDALHKLESSSLWELPEKANCQLVTAKANADHHNHSDDNHHDDHDRDRDHHHDKHHGHDDHHSHNNHDKHNHQGHMDFAVTYTYQCQNPEAITSLKTHLFDQFENSQKLVVQALTTSGQHSAELTRNKPEVKL